MAMLFRVKGDFTFEAEDVDDAFARLRDHFAVLAGDDAMKGDALITSGSLEIAPAEHGFDDDYDNDNDA
jgi:hypothetical protein